MIKHLLLLIGLGLVGWSATEANPGGVIPTPTPQVADTAFRHNRHTAFTCTDCHTMQGGHGALRVRDVSDCRSCHHAQEQVDTGCATCHRSTELSNVVFVLNRMLTLSVREDVVDREVRFDHANHDERACTECHTAGPTLAVPDLDCQGCHEEHHEVTNDGCMSCHEMPPKEAHTPEVHETCAGSGCHVEAPIEAPPRTRVGCLWCHEDRVDHEPQEEYIECHLVSVPLAVGALE